MEANDFESRRALELSNPKPELDEEDNITPEESYENYQAILIVDSIGKVDFMSIYLNMINDVRQISIEKQIVLCGRIVDKIEEEFDFTFPMKIEFADTINIDRLYEFLEFLHKDYVDFLSSVWKLLGIDLRKLPVDKFCNENKKKIMEIVEFICQTSNYSRLIMIFLRTNNKEKMIEFIKNKTLESRMLIVLAIMEKNLQSQT